MSKANKRAKGFHNLGIWLQSVLHHYFAQSIIINLILVEIVHFGEQFVRLCLEKIESKVLFVEKEL